jgi:AraC family transcriptional regulator
MSEYQEQFERVLSYIDDNLTQPLTLTELSAIAGFSTDYGQMHFLRQFNAMFKVGLFEYIHLLRDLQSVFELAYRPNMPIAAIALNAGHVCPKAFSDGFNARNGMTPEAFREKPEWGDWFEKQQPIDKMREPSLTCPDDKYTVTLVELPLIELAVFEHQGPVSNLHASLQTFIAWRRALHTPPTVSRTFNLVYHDPNNTAPEDYRFDIGAQIHRPLTTHDSGIVTKQLPKGRYALLAHIGNEPSLMEALNYLYGQWLVHSGEHLADFPLVFERIALFPDVAQHKAVTHIYLPLKS